MKRFFLLIILMASAFCSFIASASMSVDCDIQLKMYNKLTQDKVRRFSGLVEYLHPVNAAEASQFYHQLEQLRTELCRSVAAGNSIKLTEYISSRLLRKLKYAGTIYYSTGNADVTGRQMTVLNKLSPSSTLVIVGRANSVGNKVDNKRLSLLRARGVADRVTAVSAIIIGLGDEQTAEELNNPLHDNRRVDIYRIQ